MSLRGRDNSISTVLVDEAFAQQSDEFISLVRQVNGSRYLAGLANRWTKDPRPWTRTQIRQYIEQPLDRPGHHPLVKRLFKHVEALREDELMALFLVAFDRLIRRKRRTRYHYDYRTRVTTQSEELFAPRDQIVAANPDRNAVNPRTGEKIRYAPNPVAPPGGKLFSYKTRGYLRRRAARYFRRLGFQQPSAYPHAVAVALEGYRDDDFASGENILDNWSLMQIAFRHSPVLVFQRTRVEVADGRSLGELSAAPRFEELWSAADSKGVLFKLATAAQSRLVRVWAMQLLKRHHVEALKSLTAEQLLLLLDHADEEVQQFGAGLLQSLSAAANWPITTWLKLLQTRSITALATITEVIQSQVSRERLSLEQCVALACARPTPVARLGLNWLEGRPVTDAATRASLVRLAQVQCDAVGFDASQYALAILGAPGLYHVDQISPFFDSLNAQVRRGAWAWLTPQSPGYVDAVLWCRLCESPYDDVRLQLVSELSTLAMQDATRVDPDDLAPIWSAVLLGVHRGSRTKLKALRQIVDAIQARPERAAALLPVLVIAIRSVRPAEARAGLSALLTVVATHPELEALVTAQLPELRLTPAEAAS